MKRHWINIKGWFEYKFNRRHLKFLMGCHKTWPWDWTGILAVEKSKILEMIDYFENIKWFDHTHDIKWMKTYIKLIDIVIDNPEECGYVNLNNIGRFVRFDKLKCSKDKALEYYKKYPQDLYWIKAWHLLNEIRKNYMGHWWD